MTQPLSCYVLTRDSERRLADALAAVRNIADEIVVVDSGSHDATLDIAREFGCRIVARTFDNFRNQRVFAEQECTHDWVLQVDSDEIVSQPLADEIGALKARAFDAGQEDAPDGFSVSREWLVLGRPVHVFYPVKAPDRVIRLFRRDRINHAGSRIIHEYPAGPDRRIVPLAGELLNYTCDSIDQLYSKIGLYTSLAAQDMQSRGESANALKIHLYPWLLAFRCYVLMGGWKDGELGRVHARYVRDTVYLKYLKLRHDCVADVICGNSDHASRGNDDSTWQ
ncbi:MAG TPA: glycosyltransferase family 2 protein [Casimicrobiaceae bacterium]|nr:glycosyltransferase family 2 protein [Casimicrobiaceae bacterium]